MFACTHATRTGIYKDFRSYAKQAINQAKPHLKGTKPNKKTPDTQTPVA
jgi:hypothetical protein